jgi:phospholipid/cholesterol/gamma-HCH transport system substrate-binding protein
VTCSNILGGSCEHPTHNGGARGVGLLASGCGFTAEDLARANNNRGDGYIVKVAVPDALNLPDGSPVRIGGVSIGKVDDVEAKDYEAIVS